MLTLALVGLLCGATLGLRFKVLVLLPAVGLALVFALSAGITHGDGAGSILLTMALLVMALQLGYLGGAITRSFVETARAGRLRPKLPRTSPLAR